MAINTQTTSILDKQFVYVPSVKTNIMETWKKTGWVPPSQVKK